MTGRGQNGVQLANACLVDRRRWNSSYWTLQERTHKSSTFGSAVSLVRPIAQLLAGAPFETIDQLDQLTDPVQG